MQVAVDEDDDLGALAQLPLVALGRDQARIGEHPLRRQVRRAVGDRFGRRDLSHHQRHAFGRALGLCGIPQTSSLFAVWFCVFLVVLVSRRIVGSTHGRSLWAIREDEVAAEAMGVDTTSYKVRAFVISSFLFNR